MAVPIDVSVGDLIATIKLLKDISSALREHGGAQSHFQQTVRHLESIQAILSHLESFHSASDQATLINAIRAQAQAVNSEVQMFISKFQKYVKTQGPTAPIGRRYGALDKIKRSRKLSKDAEKLAKSVDLQMRNIQVLLDLDQRYAPPSLVSQVIDTHQCKQ